MSVFYVLFDKDQTYIQIEADNEEEVRAIIGGVLLDDDASISGQSPVRFGFKERDDVRISEEQTMGHDRFRVCIRDGFVTTIRYGRWGKAVTSRVIIPLEFYKNHIAFVLEL